MLLLCCSCTDKRYNLDTSCAAYFIRVGNWDVVPQVVAKGGGGEKEGKEREKMEGSADPAPQVKSVA